MLTVSKEDYLKAIAEAEAEGQPVIGARLAHWLSVTPPAVTFAVKRLTKDGLVFLGKNSEIRLTPEGRKIAEATIVCHHLIERMLFEIFDMPWHQVHEKAERLGHAVSPMFEKKQALICVDLANWENRRDPGAKACHAGKSTVRKSRRF